VRVEERILFKFLEKSEEENRFFGRELAETPWCFSSSHKKDLEDGGRGGKK